MRHTTFLPLIPLLILATACTVSYQFNGASIDYTRTRTLTVRSFTNQATLVYPQLAPMFNETLRDLYSRQTRLTQVNDNGDLTVEGEITDYAIAPMSVGSDGISTETRLTVTVNVRFTNKANPEKDFERKFSAYQNFSNTQTLNQVQEELCQTIVNEITETIFNQTVADW
ncbi:MAG: LptE family protein [Paludibacteraceae bacterium]|nr:LptE family protein [Paludibacteraceae bacterium]MCR4619988.1 hypothetical protein [Paludibacteraceae bacterium]